MRSTSIGTTLAGIAMTLAIGASAQQSAHRFDFEKWAEGQQLRTAVFERAMAIRPDRRDSPLRYLNINDDEIREVQAITAKYLPHAMVNISPVVTGCPCEEGSQCTDQLYVVAVQGDTTLGVQLSRVKNVWQLGVVQDWWWRYASLEKKVDMAWEEYAMAWDRLAREFPRCANLAETKLAEVKQ
jgi:hypothetical protein